ncbi:MAG: hypothetical protein N4J56_001483 [Chroococcidiopsis sp. SAG 2025]|uniref:hypothetical protein n=1 Tax=Chroococcidiopsis sp. SAG 2025 TaxID=171389 RepID=UPI002937181B|nr:hypothetical protein [Chroococcidiopsis sp. SAG 2025]MDV2991829.1 hypothetical protein [Chroococcidiopsis sp. SAG 2025]
MNSFKVKNKMMPKAIPFAIVATQIVILICLCLAFSVLVIKDFYHPLTGFTGPGLPGYPDSTVNKEYVDLWEYTGFYFAKNFDFFPVPHLNLTNNQAFYPYGTNSVFQPWGIEKDLFYAGLYSLFQTGPWLQLYYLLSIVVTVVFTFFLLRKDYGLYRAAGAGFIAAFFNFYAIAKYPQHVGYAILHWTILSFFADFLIVKRVVMRQHVSLRLILLRVCLLVLSLGQDLGYVAGYALTSFTVSILYIIALNTQRYFIQKKIKIKKLLRLQVLSYKRDFFTHPKTSLILLAITAIASYIYLPLVLQIGKAAKSLSDTGDFYGAWWTNPARLIIPFFPFLNPGQNYANFFLDSTEAFFDGSPGWFLLIIGTVGLWQARKHIGIFVPLLIILLLCLLYHPTFLPTLKIFPWFSFNRVSGRSTLVYAVIFCIFALGINLEHWRSFGKKLLAVALVLLACTELYTAYSYKAYYQPASLNENFYAYMNYIKEQPGEAVLDFPFCVHGGNGIGPCPYYVHNSGIFTLRRFHEKKVMGQYFGRLHPSQAEPYIAAGWDKLLAPDTQKKTSIPQVKCFRSDEWSFFTDFYKLNDFAGINLYTDLLTKDCTQEFYGRFGVPTMVTEAPTGGRIEFIPKSTNWRLQVNSGLGASLKFQPLLDSSETNLLQNSAPYSLNLTGLEGITKDEQQKKFRWGIGEKTELTFYLSVPQDLVLTFSFDNPISPQDIIVEIDGTQIERIAPIQVGDRVQRQLKFQGIAGQNTITFKYQNRSSFFDVLQYAMKHENLEIKPLPLEAQYGNWKSQRAIRFRQLSIQTVKENKSQKA